MGSLKRKNGLAPEKSKKATSPLKSATSSDAQPIALARDLLVCAQEGGDPLPLINKLTSLEEAELEKALAPSNDHRKAFWINLYNGFSALFLKERPELLSQPYSRLKHFMEEKILIARRTLSLNDIEHGMIRNSRVWWAKGYLRKWFVPRMEKKLRVTSLDPRIHFALNCGAKSCPPIRSYEPENLDEQLNAATRSFLEQEVEFSEARDQLHVSKLFAMYSGDFGGKKGILDFLKRFRLIPSHAHPSLSFKPYDWQPEVQFQNT